MDLLKNIKQKSFESDWMKDHGLLRLETKNQYGFWTAFCQKISDVNKARTVAAELSADDGLVRIKLGNETIYLFQNGNQIYP